jgi:adenylate kinase
MLNIALFGPPGAGKGTQSNLLIEKYKLVHISTGDILRYEIKDGTKLGLEAKAVIEKGSLVSDELIVQILEKKMRANTDSNGFLFDGFPRTFVQAYILEGLLLKMHTSLLSLISIEVTKDECKQRLLERGKTSGRSDDTEDVIDFRLIEYKNKTFPVLKFYEEREILESINGMGKIDDIFSRITNSIEKNLRKVLFNIVILGYPGSGRGTQAKMIAKKFNLVYISTGDILQEELNKKTDIGIKIKDYIANGKLVPDEIVIRLIEKKIKLSKDVNGFVFKGFPRTIIQAYILDGLLRKQKASLSCIIDLSVPVLQLVKRLAQRGKTKQKRNYDVQTESIVKRLEEHEKKSIPILKYYKKEKDVITINGLGDKESIFKEILAHMEYAIKNVR